MQCIFLDWFTFLLRTEGNMYLSLIICLIRTVLTDVIVEKVSNFKPIRIYEDQPARWQWPDWEVFQHPDVCFLRFGDALPDSGLTGYLVQAQPELACHDIKPPPAGEHLRPGLHWIALIRDSVRWWEIDREFTFFFNKVSFFCLGSIILSIVYIFHQEIKFSAKRSSVHFWG